MSILNGRWRWRKKTVKLLIRSEVHLRKTIEISEDVFLAAQSEEDTPEGAAARDALSDAISAELPDFEDWDDFHILREDSEVVPNGEEESK
jgi:hypothetical protein